MPACGSQSPPCRAEQKSLTAVTSSADSGGTIVRLPLNSVV